ncbi:MAG: hypothetical protein JWO38_3356 [Gemmataceae bacterium]|nr:hypothetical protein [Gemmataceae bacterium]
MFFASETFVQLHVAISMAAIGSGFVVVYGLLANRRFDGWTAFFLATTVLTSVTGFLFPFNGITPGVIVGVLSLVTLAGALYARYIRRLAGGWRRVYVIGAVVSLYFNFFVLVVQAFQKVPALRSLAPEQTDPPFAIVQAITLAAFVVLGWLAVVRFRDRPVAVAG